MCDAKPIVLIGMSGAGKSTVACQLAPKLQRNVVDSDEEMSRRLGRHCAELLREDALAFRDLEVEVIRELLKRNDANKLIVSVGGGAVLREETQRVLKDAAAVVWLQARPETLITRVLLEQEMRPMLQNDAERTIPMLVQQRNPIYENTADVIVSVDEKTPTEAADAIIALLSTEKRGPM